MGAGVGHRGFVAWAAVFQGSGCVRKIIEERVFELTDTGCSMLDGHKVTKSQDHKVTGSWRVSLTRDKLFQGHMKE